MDTRLILSTVVTNRRTGVRSYPEFDLDDLTEDNLAEVTQIATKWGDVSDESKAEAIKIADAMGWENTSAELFTFEGEDRYWFIRKDSRGINSSTLLAHLASLTKHASRV